MKIVIKVLLISFLLFAIGPIFIGLLDGSCMFLSGRLYTTIPWNEDRVFIWLMYTGFWAWTACIAASFIVEG